MASEITCPNSGDLLSPRDLSQEERAARSVEVRGKRSRDPGVMKEWSVKEKQGRGETRKLKRVLG